MSRVAVLGCGLFGACIALKLRERGYDVVVFERLPEPICGASFNSMGRLHLGFHYPRDNQTARQCIAGFSAFRDAFPEAIVEGFPNAYFIASENSKTTGERFLAFADDLGLSYRRLDPAAFVPRVVGVELGVETDEVVYDAAAIRKTVIQRMDRLGVDLRLGVDIVAAEHGSRQIVLVDAQGRRESFDATVNAAYANISRLARSLGLPVARRQYEYTAIPIVRGALPRVGITVMDGPFVSMLPFGAGDCHTLYHVQHSVLATSISA